MLERSLVALLVPALASALQLPRLASVSPRLPSIATAAATTGMPLVATAAEQSALPSFTLASVDIDIFFIHLRDPVDVYYFAIAVAATLYFVSKAVGNVVSEAKGYDERGEMANQMLREKKKRERAEAREYTKRNDPAYERLQAEAKQRAERKAKWKVFDVEVPEWVPGAKESAD